MLTQEQMTKFAKTYNIFIITFLLGLFLQVVGCFGEAASSLRSYREICQGICIIAQLLAIPISIIAMVYMFLAAKDSQSELSQGLSLGLIIICLLNYFMLTQGVSSHGFLGLIGLILLILTFNSFFKTFKKHGIYANFLITSSMIERGVYSDNSTTSLSPSEADQKPLEQNIIQEKMENKELESPVKILLRGLVTCLGIIGVVVIIVMSLMFLGLSFEESASDNSFHDDNSDYDFWSQLNTTNVIATKSKAADGDAEAQYNMGVFYEHGEGVEQNYELALDWYRKAADQDYPAGQRAVGTFYQYGRVVEKNEEEAVKWYEKAAQQNDEKAQVFLGEAYFWGAGVEKNYELAVKWFSLVEEDPVAQYYLGICYLNGHGVAKDEKKAFDLFTLSAEKGHRGSNFKLGICYFLGYGVAKDADKGLDYIVNAANNGDVSAQAFLGNIYLVGEGVEADPQEGVKWLRKSIENGSVEGITSLGWCYSEGVGVPQNKAEAIALYFKAANQGEKRAQFLLGQQYLESGVVDVVEAKKWINRSAEQGVPEAEYMMGIFAATGEGGEQSDSEALKWFNRAAAHGNEVAKQIIQEISTGKPMNDVLMNILSTLQ